MLSAADCSMIVGSVLSNDCVRRASRVHRKQ